MKKLFVFLLVFAVNHSLAIDCSSIPPFQLVGSQEVKVSAVRFFYESSTFKEEDICQKTVSLSVYDVRGRENEAYLCLKPQASQVISCSTTYLSETAKIYIVPGSWIRKGSENLDWRASRFHAYIQPDTNPQKYLDIFSRNLSLDLENKKMILEGSKKSGETSPSNEGFWVRLSFQ